MASPPRRPSFPTTPQSFRRSFTAPVKLPPSPQPEHVDPSDAAADILYSHPSTKTFSFSPPTAGISKPASLDLDYPVDTIETLPWSAPRESLVAQGPLVIEKVRGSTAFLKTGTVLHAMMKNSQCWCVDGDSKFVLRVRQFSYYRIEFPNATEEDRQRIEQLKGALRKILRFEVTPCPFKRDFKVELPESTITPKKKRAWQPRKSLSMNSPLSLTSPAPDRDDRPESRASNISDAMTEGEVVDESDFSQTSASSEDDGAEVEPSGETKVEGVSENNSEVEISSETNVESVHENEIEKQEATASNIIDAPSEDLEVHEEHSQLSPTAEASILDQESTPELAAASTEPPHAVDQPAQFDLHDKPELASPVIEESLHDAVPEREDAHTTDELLEEQRLEVDTQAATEKNASEINSISQVNQTSMSSPSRVDPADFGLESPVKSEHFDSGLPILTKSPLSTVEDSESAALKEDNISISGESFHSMATRKSSSSSLNLSPTYWDAILPVNSHKRGISEVTVKAEDTATNESVDSNMSKQPSMPKLVRDSPLDTEWTETETPTPSDGVRRLLKEKRVRLPPPSSSSIIEPSQRSSDRHLVRALVQKAASFAVGKPLEAVILLLHVFGRIAAGATVNDLLSGELFRQPDKSRGGRSTLTPAETAHEDDDLDEDDYNYPIRARDRSTMREGPDSDVD